MIVNGEIVLCWKTGNFHERGDYPNIAIFSLDGELKSAIVFATKPQRYASVKHFISPPTGVWPYPGILGLKPSTTCS